MKNVTILTLLLCLLTNYSWSQTRNLSVEGNGQQYGVIQSLDAGDVGLELVRGNTNSDTDWRILNNGGNFRIQSNTNNFTSSGSNRLSILENGNIGIGCTNPGTKLTICGGELSFSAGFTGSPGDKIALNGYTIDAIEMVGIGHETSTYTDNGTSFYNVDEFYFKSEGAYRWYSNINADVGLNSSMTLDRGGNLGIGTDDPVTRFQIEGGSEASLSQDGYVVLGDKSGQNMVMDHNEIQTRNNGSGANLFINPVGGDAYICGTLNVDRDLFHVGIGTSSPDEKLQIVGGSDANATDGGYVLLGNTNADNLGIDDNEIQARSAGSASTLYLQNGGGDVSIGASGGNTNGVLTVESESTQMHLRNSGVGGANWWFGASNDGWNVGGQKFVFDDDSSSSNPILMLDGASEAVAIGFNNVPTGYTLAVDGNVICEEVRVEMSGNWPDYVFEENYPLLSINELEESIQTNGHLPNIPSAREIETEGIALGDMQKRMMEKIEELSLYIIQLKHENDVLKERMEDLEKQ